MAMASASTVALGSVAFGMFWVLAVFPAVPFLPIGRTAGSLLGAVLMVVFRVITPEQAYAAIDLPILGLLFGTMAVGGFLERADMFKHLGKLLSWRSRGGKDLLCRVCVVSAISSALFTNDTACVVLTEFILKIAKQDNLPPRIFLLALASSANIGSSATPIGNPQNLVIAIQGKISFGQFLIGILPAMIAGILVNAAILLLYFLAISPGENSAAAEGAVTEASAEDETASHRFSPATMSHVSPLNSPQRSPDADDGIQHSGNAEALRNGVVISESALTAVTVVSTMDQTNISPSPEEKESSAGRRKTLLWKLSVYLATLGMLISLLVGLDMSWTAITAALALMLLDFRDARPCLEKVSFSLLIFFCGMFITVDGFNKTGIPGALWDLMEPHARIDRASGVIVLALAIIALSNIASNVPTVLLLGGRVAASASAISAGEETRAWLMLAWISTVAGNLSLLGSAANLIVCEQAGKAPSLAYNLSFWSHLRFGVPSTLLVTFVGLLLLWNY